MSGKRHIVRNGSDATESTSLSEDTVFEILSNRRRRYVFHYLKRNGREVYLRELSEHVAAWEEETPPDQLDASDRKRVKTALHQHHLPKMDKTGFVEYDAPRGTATLSEEAADLEVYLDVVPVGDVSWSHYYLGLSLVGLVGITLASGLSVSAVTNGTIAVFLTVTLLVSAAVHTYFNRVRLRLGGTDRPPEVENAWDDRES